jgi:hypothetical protein
LAQPFSPTVRTLVLKALQPGSRKKLLSLPSWKLIFAEQPQRAAEGLAKDAPPGPPKQALRDAAAEHLTMAPMVTKTSTSLPFLPFNGNIAVDVSINLPSRKAKDLIPDQAKS